MAVSTQKLLPQSKGGAIAKITPMAYKKSAGGEDKKDTIVVIKERCIEIDTLLKGCLLYTSPSPRDYAASRMPSSA